MSLIAGLFLNKEIINFIDLQLAQNITTEQVATVVQPALQQRHQMSNGFFFFLP